VRRPPPPLLALLALLAACDAWDSEGVQVSPPCPEPQRVESLRPADGTEAAWIGGPLVVRIACPEPNGVVTVATEDGTELAAELSVARAGRQLRLQPLLRLPNDTSLIARLDTPSGHREWSFGTGSVGAPVGTELAGRGLALRFGAATVLDPAGVDEELEDAVADLNLALVLPDDAGSALGVRLGRYAGALADAAGDPAVEPIEAACAWDDPDFRCPFDRLEFPLPDGEFVLHDAVLTGALGPTGGGGFALVGRWDTDAAGLGDVCAASADDEGPVCGPCPGGGDGCIDLRLVHVTAREWAGEL